LIQLRLST